MSLWIGNYRLFCMIQDDSMINSAFNNDRHPDVYKELRTSIIKDQKNYPQIFYAWIVRKFKKNKKSLLLKAFTIKWQGWRESNSHQRFWRPLFYHWTTPLKLVTRTRFELVNDAVKGRCVKPLHQRAIFSIAL